MSKLSGVLWQLDEKGRKTAVVYIIMIVSSYGHSHHKLGKLLGRLRKGVFERPRQHAESGLFTFLSSGFANILSYIVSTRVQKLGKSSLPVDVRLSKTPLLKLRIVSYITRDTVVPGPLDSTYFSCYFKLHYAF